MIGIIDEKLQKDLTATAVMCWYSDASIASVCGKEPPKKSETQRKGPTARGANDETPMFQQPGAFERAKYVADKESKYREMRHQEEIGNGYEEQDDGR